MNMSRADCGFQLYGRGELVEAAPHLLGYQPEDSLVAFALATEDNVIRAVTCVDLAEASAPELPSVLIQRMRESGAEKLAVLVYPPDGTPPPEVLEAEVGLLPHDQLVEDLAALAIGAGIDMLGGLYVCDNRWWVYLPCGDAACCPGRGVPIPPASRATAVAAYAGLDVLPDRAALNATFDPIEGQDGERMRRAVGAAEQELLDAATAGDVGRWRTGMLIQLRSALDRALTKDVPWLSDRVAARLILGLTDQVVRDRAWLWVEGDLDGRWIAADRLWRQLARRAPEDYQVAPLFLSAWACWRGGDGIRARIGLERALGIDPIYTAALLLEEAISKWADPRILGPLTSKRELDRTGPPGPKPTQSPRPGPPKAAPRGRLPQRVRRR
jgi:Domain of unknown function (DUF4192)